jgi:hypothetical protein
MSFCATPVALAIFAFRTGMLDPSPVDSPQADGL